MHTKLIAAVMTMDPSRALGKWCSRSAPKDTVIITTIDIIREVIGVLTPMDPLTAVRDREPVTG